MNEDIDFPESERLTEVVRIYVSALIRNHGILPFKYRRTRKKKETGEVFEDLEFGVSDPDAISKKVVAENRKRAAKKRKEMLVEHVPEEKKKIPYADMIPDRVYKYTPEELSELAELAVLALARASELAGEPVVYCCAHIRKERLHDKKCPNSGKWRYKHIAELVNNSGGQPQPDSKDHNEGSVV